MDSVILFVSCRLRLLKIHRVEIPASAERQVRTTELCTIALVLVTRIKGSVTGSAKQKKNDNSPSDISTSPSVVNRHLIKFVGWRHEGYDNRQISCGLGLSPMTCVTLIQPVFPGTLFLFTSAHST